VLYIDINVTDTLIIGDVSVTLTRKGGKKAQLRIDADPDIVIEHRLGDKTLTLNKKGATLLRRAR
jgi:hypothetical protein